MYAPRLQAITLDMKRSTDNSAQRYPVPALDKGLDLLELLAAQPRGLSLSELAAAASRKVSEIFRMVDCLKRRGYIGTDAQTERLTLSMRLFELAHRHPPTERLVSAALPPMEALATRVGQSCHLAVHSAGEMLVIAQVDSALQMGLAVHVGARVGMTTSSSGRVFLAFQNAQERERILALQAQPPEVAARARTAAKGSAAKVRAAKGKPSWVASIERIEAAGFEAVPSDLIRGVTNISWPVFDFSGRCTASMTVPYLQWDREGHCDLATTIDRMKLAARAISAAIGHSGDTQRPAPQPSVRRRLKKPD